MKFKGKVLKDLGDGVIVNFSDLLQACLAAINIKYRSSIGQIKSKGIWVLGLVEEVKLDKVLDIYGSTIDRCARIEKYAFPSQLLIDRACMISLVFVEKLWRPHYKWIFDCTLEFFL